MHTCQIHGQEYAVYDWKTFGEHVFELSKKIFTSNDHFDRIVALAKGGTAISRPIADYIGVNELSSIQIEFYTGIGTTSKTPVITQSLPVRIRDERVLIIDDIADSGETLILAANYMKQHGVADVKTATLVTKPWTKKMPDFSYYESEAWLIFPWESRESIQLLSQIWHDAGDSQEIVMSQLKELGFTPDEIELFLPLF
jgi:uncharacterized protein